MKTSGGNEAEEEERDRRKSVPPVLAEKQSVAVKAALAALRIYKVYLSILFAGSCRFEPTCSRYAYEAIERFGVMRGSWMGLKRLLRCQPLSRKFGYDPVPEKTEAAALQAGGIRQDDGRAAVTSREAHS
jgi:putative membrane protein insertion efficiency factor